MSQFLKITEYHSKQFYVSSILDIAINHLRIIRQDFQQGGAMKLHFVRSIRGLQNFLAIPIMNPLAGFMIVDPFAKLLWIFIFERGVGA